jgi:opacity protein-like surface antigen
LKKLIVIAIILFSTSFLQAQKARFGVKAGLNLTTIDGYSDAKMLASYNAGLFSEIEVTHRIGVQLELMYSAQGAKFEKTTNTLNYVNVPVLFKYYLFNGLFNVQAGPQIGFLVSSKSDIKNYSDTLNKSDFSFLIGPGYNFTDDLSVDARYYYSFTQLNKTGNNNLDTRNSVFQINIGYKF